MNLFSFALIGLGLSVATVTAAETISVTDGAGTTYQLEADGSYRIAAEGEDGTTYLLGADGRWEAMDAAGTTQTESQQVDEQVRELEAVAPESLTGGALDAQLTGKIEAYVERQDPEADDAAQADAVRCLKEVFMPLPEAEKRMFAGQPTLDAALDLWTDEAQPQLKDEVEQQVETCVE